MISRSVKMEFSSQPLSLEVNNFDHNKSEKKNRHGSLLPDTMRALFVGPSNCGKTNCLLALITHPNGLRFENVYIYSKSLNQPKYKFLQELLEPIDGMQYLAFNDQESVISPEEALPNSIMIFDDIACEKQDSVKAFFCMGRHKNVDSFYLSQSYARVPKHLVRDNVNFLIVFQQDETNIKHIYSDHVNTDMSFTRFKDLCTHCWNGDKHGFLVIDKDSQLNEGRYRKGFDCFAINM
uniref:Uncharacterized protein n=1 Tax=Trichogramma kaykai TaxID=54128 RepID=A0ABD2W597_9HYME